MFVEIQEVFLCSNAIHQPSNYVPVEWNIQNNDCSPTQYHLTDIGLPYVVGHSYSASVSPTSSTQVTFSLTDTTVPVPWTKTYTVPSTTIVYDYNAFSPASAIEGVPYRTSPSYTNVPYFPFTVQHGHTTVSHVTLATLGFNVPTTTITTQTVPTGTQGTWNWSMIGDSPPTVSALSPDRASPQPVGTIITWMCSASDPNGDPISYEFWLQAGTGPWVVVQGWQVGDLVPTSIWSWTLTVPNPSLVRRESWDISVRDKGWKRAKSW